MASSGPGGAQQRRRAGPSWGKGRGTFIKGSGDGGGRGAAQKKAEPGGMHVQRKSVQSGEKDKKRWKSAQQINAGSAKEGQGFALWRKQKVQLEYKRLQRKQKKTTTPKDLYADNYPEHLKHLYLAEEEKLKNLERKRKPEEDITQKQKKTTTPKDLYADNYPEHLKHLYLPEEEKLKNLERKRKPEEDITQTTEERVEEVPKKKFKNKTSIQKAKEEYKRVQNERANKRKEAEENRRQREEAKELYKKKKMEAFKVLSTKTKKGQPNFNVQMEYLLKKIQSKT